MAHIEDYNIITKEDILSDKELFGDIIWDLKEKIDDSWTFVNQKRKVFHERQTLKTNPGVFQENRIKIHTAYSQEKAFIATFFNDDMSVKFVGKTTADDEKSEKLEQVAKYDYKAMGKKDKDFMRYSNLFNFGVWLRIKIGWDNTTMCPIYENADPMSWLPDPDGSTINNEFSYHMFQMVNTINGLESVNSWSPGTYFNIDKIDSTSTDDEYDEGYRREEQEVRLLTNPEDKRSSIYIVNCYVEYGENKYICTLANQKSLIIRRERIEPVSKDEKKNPYSVPFPVSITNLYPLRNDCFGLAPLELIIDKQNAQNRLMNLSIFQEENSVFRKYIVDTDIIPELDVLSARNDKGSVYFPAKKKVWFDKDVTSAVVPIQDHQIHDQSKIMLQDKISDLMESTTWFTEGNRWVAVESKTLWQTRIQQQNANLMFSLDASLISSWEEHFWRVIRYRSLLENLTSSNKKIIRVSNLYLPTTIELSNKDLFDWYSPDVQMISKRLVEEKNKQDVVTMTAQRPLIQQDPTIPAVSKKMYLRKMFEKQGIDRDMINKYVPYSIDEIRAKQYVEMINNDIDVKNMFKENMDLMTYWIYIQDAKNSEAKYAVLDQLITMMSERSQQQEPSQDEWDIPNLQWVTNSLASNQISNMVSQQGNREISIQGWS